VWEPQGADLEFDIPFRELAFEGVPFRSTVNVLPTVNCLVELTEMPFLVCPLEEVSEREGETEGGTGPGGGMGVRSFLRLYPHV
jgi:hypothetical protein